LNCMRSSTASTVHTVSWALHESSPGSHEWLFWRFPTIWLFFKLNCKFLKSNRRSNHNVSNQIFTS